MFHVIYRMFRFATSQPKTMMTVTDCISGTRGVNVITCIAICRASQFAEFRCSLWQNCSNSVAYCSHPFL